MGNSVMLKKDSSHALLIDDDDDEHFNESIFHNGRESSNTSYNDCYWLTEKKLSKYDQDEFVGYPLSPSDPLNKIFCDDNEYTPSSTLYKPHAPGVSQVSSAKKRSFSDDDTSEEQGSSTSKKKKRRHGLNLETTSPSTFLSRTGGESETTSTWITVDNKDKSTVGSDMSAIHEESRRKKLPRSFLSSTNKNNTFEVIDLTNTSSPSHQRRSRKHSADVDENIPTLSPSSSARHSEPRVSSSSSREGAVNPSSVHVRFPLFAQAQFRRRQERSSRRQQQRLCSRDRFSQQGLPASYHSFLAALTNPSLASASNRHTSPTSIGASLAARLDRSRTSWIQEEPRGLDDYSGLAASLLLDEFSVGNNSNAVDISSLLFNGLNHMDEQSFSYEELWDLTERLGHVKSKAANASIISRLPIHKHKKAPMASFASSEDAQCSVCLVDYETGEKLKCLPCSHQFHCECIDTWLKRNGSCPICRYSLVS